jgi:hypothetical protein
MPITLERDKGTHHRHKAGIICLRCDAAVLKMLGISGGNCKQFIGIQRNQVHNELLWGPKQDLLSYGR